MVSRPSGWWESLKSGWYVPDGPSTLLQESLEIEIVAIDSLCERPSGDCWGSASELWPGLPCG